MTKTLLIAAGLALAPAALAGSPNNLVVDFEDGNTYGWSLNGWDTVSFDDGGNPGARLHWDDFIDNFGMEARNSSDPNFIGDYGAKGPVTISIDYKVDYINFFGTPADRELTLQLRDYDEFNGFAPATVWIKLTDLPGTGMPWTTLTVDILDPNSETLPEGWEGAGAEDPDTFEPILPEGRTFANVLAGVDEIAFSTYTPGFFYGFTNFDVSIDNVSITPIPAPGAVALAGLAGVCGLRRRRA